jgi:DNA-binding response OmpR family regulator
MRVGILEDDPDQQALLELWLSELGYSCHCYADIAGMLRALNGQTFDFLILDWMLPDGSGEQVLQWARKNMGWDTGIVILTATDDEKTVVSALSAGADDYVVKPPKKLEFLARIIATSRRARPTGLPVLTLGGYEIDLQRQAIKLNQRTVTLTQKEFDLAVCLFQSPDKLLSRDHLLNKVWGLNTDVATRTVDTHVSRLRKKLSLDGSHGWKMIPVYGCGYRLERVNEPIAATSMA